MLTLLDLSAAFDSVDHDTLLRRLQMSYGLGGAVINWFTLYLAGRTQFVASSASRCTPTSVLYGVPRGSVLGPILFLLYTADVLQLVKSHQLQPHAYADDTQICGSYRPPDVNILQERVSDCIDEVSTWMMANRLQDRGTLVFFSSPSTSDPDHKYVLATRLFCPSLPSATSGSTSTLTSPCLLTSPRPSEPVSLNCGRYVVCGVR